MKLQRIAAGLIIVLVGVMVGCSSKESTVTGTWSGTVKLDGNDIPFKIELFSDKTANSELAGVSLPSAKWTILNDGRLKIDGAIHFQAMTGGSATIFAEIHKHSLILDLGPNGKATLTK